MMEWADVLNEWKCGGPRPDWRDEIEVKIGDRYKLIYNPTGDVEKIITVTEDNIRQIRWNLIDPENDLWSYEKVKPSRRAPANLTRR